MGVFNNKIYVIYNKLNKNNAWLILHCRGPATPTNHFTTLALVT